MSGEDFSSKLRRLRREPVCPKAEDAVCPKAEDGGPAAPEEPESPGLPGWLRSRLDSARERASGTAPPEPAGATTLGPPEELTTYAGPEGEVAARVTSFSRAHVHGEFRLGEIDETDSTDFALLTGDERLADLDLSRAIYLDTETTGLSGGAGTYVFQIGLGRFEAERYELWQGFLR